MGFLHLEHLRLMVLYLDNQKVIELLVGEHDLGLHPVLLELGLQLLRLRE